MKKIVVLSGSGISAESGISTFRGGNGLWDNEPVEAVATIDGWYRDPARVLRFYNERRAQLATVEPNEAHRIVAELEKDFDVTVVTQNVDNLHERAGSTNIIHLHGELTKVRPEDTYTDMDWWSERYVQDIGYKPINLGDKGGPHNTQLRPHIVWFGEYVDGMELAEYWVQQADIFVVVGTSLVVYPAAGLVDYAPREIPKFLIDPKDLKGGLPAGFQHIKAKAVEGVDELVRRL